MPNFTLISQTISEIWPLFDYSIRHLKFSKVLTAGTIQRINMHHRAKFCADQSNRCQYMAIFRFFNITVIRYLGF